jgi:putative ABC transport system ATP-binding protein
MERTMYELQSVTKRYRRGSDRVEALSGVDLTIPDGQFLAIQGQTGSGKSTLLQLLGALDRPTEGSVRYEGSDLASKSEAELGRLRAHEFGFVFQSFNLIPTMTAQENVEAALVPLGVHARARSHRAVEALEEVGLAHRLRHVPGELSGGEQQRTAIARALVKDPRVILADEPTGNLDEATRDEILGLLVHLWAERGTTLIVVTHDGAVAGMARRRARLEQGTIEPGEPVDAVQQPIAR